MFGKKHRKESKNGTSVISSSLSSLFRQEFYVFYICYGFSAGVLTV